MKKLLTLIIQSVLCYVYVCPNLSSDSNYESFKFLRLDLDKEDQNSSLTRSSNKLMKNSAHEFAQRMSELRDTELGTSIIEVISFLAKLIFLVHPGCSL